MTRHELDMGIRDWFQRQRLPMPLFEINEHERHLTIIYAPRGLYSSSNRKAVEIQKSELMSGSGFTVRENDRSMTHRVASYMYSEMMQAEAELQRQMLSTNVAPIFVPDNYDLRKFVTKKQVEELMKKVELEVYAF